MAVGPVAELTLAEFAESIAERENAHEQRPGRTYHKELLELIEMLIATVIKM